MNDVINYQEQLPDTLEDLSRFVLVNEERVQALRAQIRAIKKVSLAKEVYEQKLAEAQEIGQITVEAAQKMGELLLTIQKSQGKRNDLETSSSMVEEVKTKSEITSEMGMTKDQVSQYQQMAQNPEAVQAAIQKAIDNGDVVSRNQVMKEIRSAKEELKRQLAEKDKKISELENREPIVKKIEVEPEDYKQLKRDLKKETKMVGALRQDLNIEKQRYDRQAKEKRKLEEKIEELQQKTVREEDKKDVNASALMFAAKCRNFLSSVGGYAFIAEYLSEMDKRERDGYIHAAKSVRDWVTILLETIERNENELFGSYK